MSVPMRSSDPAYFLLEEGLADPSKRSRPTVYRRGCYICDNPSTSHAHCRAAFSFTDGLIVLPNEAAIHAT